MTTCRDIGPNPSARFPSLAAAYTELHVRPDGDVPATFVDGAPAWARYQRGRSFDVSGLGDEARRCLTSSLGHLQDLRETLERIDYFRRNYDANNPSAGGNRANPNDPNDRGDANTITQYEIEQFVWETVRGEPETVRWDRLRDQGDETMRRLHAVLGVIQYLQTDPPPAPVVPPPEHANEETGWWDRNGTAVTVGGIGAGAVLVTALAAFLRIRGIRRTEGEARAKAEADIPAIREQIRRVQQDIAVLEAQRIQAVDALHPINSVDLAAVTPRVEALRQGLETARQELSLAQAQFDLVSKVPASRRRSSRTRQQEYDSARLRRDGALSAYSRIESDLRAQESSQHIGTAFDLLAARPRPN